MSKSTTLTIRVEEDVKERLEAAAKLQKRSKSFLATEAIEGYLSLQEWQIEGINNALQSLDAGKGIPHEDVMSWIRSWGTDKEKSKPAV